MRQSLLSFIAKSLAVVKTGISRTRSMAACSKSRVKLLPWRARDQDLPDLMFWAANTGHRGADDTVVLKEVEMSPAHLLEIMGVAELPAYWTGEKRARSGCYGEAKFVRTFGCIEQLSGNLPGPFMFPITQQYGVDPVWFGVFVTMMMVLAGISPPVGLNVFVVRSVCRHIPIMTIYRGHFPSSA